MSTINTNNTPAEEPPLFARSSIRNLSAQVLTGTHRLGHGGLHLKARLFQSGQPTLPSSAAMGVYRGQDDDAVFEDEGELADATNADKDGVKCVFLHRTLYRELREGQYVANDPLLPMWARLEVMQQQWLIEMMCRRAGITPPVWPRLRGDDEVVQPSACDPRSQWMQEDKVMRDTMNLALRHMMDQQAEDMADDDDM